MKKADRIELKERVLQAQKKLPHNYMAIYEFMFGEQDPDVKYKIQNVMSTKVVDEEITKNLEKMAKKSKLIA